VTDIHVSRTGMLYSQTGLTYEQLERCQARAEERGIHGDALREVLSMLAQPLISEGGSS
jgi:hypothetical protein